MGQLIGNACIEVIAKFQRMKFQAYLYWDIATEIVISKFYSSWQVKKMIILEAVALPTNDAKVVIWFLKKYIFIRYGTP